MPDETCRVEHPRSNNPIPNTRIVRCGKPAGHPGRLHAEALEDGEFGPPWAADETPVQPDVRCTDQPVTHLWDEHGHCVTCPAVNDWPAPQSTLPCPHGPVGDAQPDPMPLFTIKAKDKLAVLAVEHYAQLCREHGLSEQAVEVDRAADELIDWRERNPGQVKLPDHPHVPAAQPDAAPHPDGANAEGVDVYRELATRAIAHLGPDSEWAVDELAADLHDHEQVIDVSALIAIGQSFLADIARLTEERDLAIAHDRQPYPTADAYERACAALRKHRERADTAERERDEALASSARQLHEASNIASQLIAAEVERDEARGELGDAQRYIAELEADDEPRPRPITIVDAGRYRLVQGGHRDDEDAIRMAQEYWRLAVEEGEIGAECLSAIEAGEVAVTRETVELVTDDGATP